MEFRHTNLEIENEYPKLVRDRIPEIIKNKEGVSVKSRILNDDTEFLKYLTKKIVEEAIELQDPINKGNLEEELADIFELTDNILNVLKKTKEEINTIQQEKREKNGGFDKRILMLGKDN
jgi:predicted house-cleaning noncanonical NTP pyrophosphatase (MazG superfamily)